MKKFKVLTAVVLVLFVAIFTSRCQHDDENVIPVAGPDPIVRGTEIMTCTNCNTTAPAGTWYLDKAHSNVMWETRYKTFGSKLTGRFNSFFMNALNFDEAHPENISFDGYVWLNSVNTSEPNRDDGCLQVTFGTGATPANPELPDNNVVENKATLISKPGTGKYSTTDDGFLVDADFTLLGITKTVTVKMFFAPRFDIGTAYAAGLNSEFEITSDDFLPNDANIGDVIKIEINNLMRNIK
jgi:polyisoprenoid-binding protein YceI